MRYLSFYLIYLCAAIVPFVSDSGSIRSGERDEAAWPAEIGGVALTRAALTEEERGFSRDFPGQIARFRAGDREVLIRYLQQPSRKLHPSADCLRGAGYRVSPQPARRDPEGGFWGCVIAEKGGRQIKACEQIRDAAGRTWYDVSSWYWAALLGRSEGPWWAVTVAGSD